MPSDEGGGHAPPIPPLTLLADDERLFRDSVYKFADREIRLLVREMDEHAKIPRSLSDKLFDLGVMGVDFSKRRNFAERDVGKQVLESRLHDAARRNGSDLIPGDRFC